jgi:PTS system nitrogen regulatory IIA component
MQIAEVLAESLVIPALKGQTKGSVLQELAESVAAHHPKIDPGRLLRALWERERLSSTGIAVGVALPHAKLSELTRIVGAVGRHPDGVDFESLDGTPTRLFFLLVAPADSTGEHLKALAQVSRLIGDAEFRERLMQTADRGELYRQIVERAERP